MNSLMGQISSYRQLLIFRNEENTVLEKNQMNVLNKAAAGVEERALKITVVEKENHLFKQYKIDTAKFTVILIGKDGYEKYRTNKLLEADQLFSIIDAMPMRRREMKKN